MLCIKRIKNSCDNEFEYSVYIDDVCKGYIYYGKYLKVKVYPGTHKVKILYKHGCSNEMTIDFNKGIDTNLICGSKAITYKDMLIPFYTMIKRKKNRLFLEYGSSDNIKEQKREINNDKFKLIDNLLCFIAGISFWDLIFGEIIGRYMDIIVFVVFYIFRTIFRHTFVPK